MKDRSENPSNHERTLLPRIYISLPWLYGVEYLANEAVLHLLYLIMECLITLSMTAPTHHMDVRQISFVNYRQLIFFMSMPFEYRLEAGILQQPFFLNIHYKITSRGCSKFFFHRKEKKIHMSCQHVISIVFLLKKTKNKQKTKNKIY